MNTNDYERQMEELRERVAVLQQANLDLINRNLQLAQQQDGYYDVRRRVQMLKEMVIRQKELLRHAGDVNGDGQVDVADHVKLSKIILNQQ